MKTFKNLNLSILLITLYLLGFSSISYSKVYIEGFETGFLDPDLRLDCYNSAELFSIQTNVVRNGNYAARFVSLPNLGKRCEVTFLSPGWFYWGQEYWHAFSFNIPSVPPVGGGYGVLNQHHSVPGPIDNPDWSISSGGNGFTIRLSQDRSEFNMHLIPPGDASLNNYVNATIDNPMASSALGGTHVYHQWSVELNRWFDVVMNFRYSDGSDGFFKVWLDGSLVVDITGSNVHLHDVAGRLKPRRNYLKIGTYPGAPGSGEVFYDEVRIGDGTSSYEDVAISPLMIFKDGFDNN